MQNYGVTARYYDPLTSVAHAPTYGRIAAALVGLCENDGPIVDVGAGTGLTTALIAATLARVEILAVEPDSAMLSALMTRVWSDPGLRRRVTILPFGILEAPLPDRIGGAVLSASLVHLGPTERALLWPLLSDRLSSNGRIVVEVQCPIAGDMAETEMASARIGRIDYRGSAEARQIGEDRQRWRMTYRASLDDREIIRDVAIYDCWTVSAERILEEAAIAGLAGYAEGDLVILGHSSV